MKTIARFGLATRSCTWLLVLALTAAGATAQAPSTDGPSVTLAITPSNIPTNGRVTLKGLAYPEGGAQVRITVTPPSGQAAVLVTTPDQNGHYSLMYGGTQAEGTYKVSAQLGTSGVPEKGEFSTRTALVDIDEDVAQNKELLHQDSALVAAVKKAVDVIPESPAKEDMEKKLEPLKKVTDQAPAQTPQLASALQNFKQLVTSYPETLPILQPVFDHLAVLGEESQETSDRIKAEVKGSQQAGANCDQIDHATQALKALPEAISQALEKFDFILGFAQAIVTNAAPDGYAPAVKAAAGAADLAHSLNEAREGEDAVEAWKKLQTAAKSSIGKNEIETGFETQYGEKLANAMPASLRANPAYKSAVTHIKEFLPKLIAGDRESTTLLTAGAKLAGDALSYGNDKFFQKYCQKFTGEFTATMTAHFYSKNDGDNGAPVEWWSFSTTIKGLMTLRYPKEAAGTAVALTGQFEGGATKFTYKEDLFNNALYGRLTKGGVVRKIDVVPVATDNGEGGLLNALESPTSFYVPVTGMLVGKTITVALQPATSDFNDTYTHAHTMYTIDAPLTLNIPIRGQFAMPYMNAHFILDHLVSHATNTFDVTREGDKLVIDRKTDKTLPGPGNSATYTMEVKACNPECE